MRSYTKPISAGLVLLFSTIICNESFADGDNDNPYDKAYKYNSGYDNKKGSNNYNYSGYSNSSGSRSGGNGTDYETSSSRYGRGNDDDDNYSNHDDDDNNYSHDDNDDSNDVPLDGGLSFLLAAGAGLGIKKAADIKAKKKEQD